MKEINAWEVVPCKTITIDELIERIKNGEKNIKVGRKYMPLDVTEHYFERLYGGYDTCINYTDENHQIIVSEFCGQHISLEYFKKYEKEIKDAFMYSYAHQKENVYFVPEFAFSQELLDMLLNYKDADILLANVKLTKKQIKQIRDKHVNVYVNGKQISSKFLVEYITYEESLKRSEFYLYIENFNKYKYSNFKYFRDNTEFIISDYLIHNNVKAFNEDHYIKTALNFLEKVDKIGKKLCFRIKVQKRRTFEKYLNQCNFENIDLRIENNLCEYSYQEYLNEEERLNCLVEPIKNSNLSPFEKYIAVYSLVKNFKPYKENINDLASSRYIKYILDNDFIVCVGYANLLECLLDKVGINANKITVGVDTSYDDGFDEYNPEEISIKLEGHSRVVVDIEDDKYGIHGLYMSDPTWDNNLDEDYLNHAIMTFDNMITAKRMFAFTTFDPILCFHTFKEYTDQINYLLNQDIKNKIKCGIVAENQEEMLLKSFESVGQHLLGSIRCDEKIKDFTDLLNICQNKKDYEEFFTKLGHYLLVRINKPIKVETLIQANNIVRKVLSNMDEDLNPSKEEYESRDIRYFPYEVPIDGEHNLTSKAR